MYKGCWESLEMAQSEYDQMIKTVIDVYSYKNTILEKV